MNHLSPGINVLYHHLSCNSMEGTLLLRQRLSLVKDIICIQEKKKSPPHLLVILCSSQQARKEGFRITSAIRDIISSNKTAQMCHAVFSARSAACS